MVKGIVHFHRAPAASPFLPSSARSFPSLGRWIGVIIHGRGHRRLVVHRYVFEVCCINRGKHLSDVLSFGVNLS